MTDIDDIRDLKLEEVFAEGGMGTVHRATDIALERTVAAKVLKPEHHDQPEVVKRFLDEARLAASLEHPNVIPIHALGVREDLGPFFTMKLVEGETLFDRLQSNRGTPHGDFVRIARDEAHDYRDLTFAWLCALHNTRPTKRRPRYRCTRSSILDHEAFDSVREQGFYVYGAWQLQHDRRAQRHEAT